MIIIRYGPHTTFGKILAFTDRHFTNIISLDRKYHIRSLLKSRDGDIWVGGDGPTLGKIVNNEFVPVENIDMNDRLFPESVLALYEDADGVLWAAQNIVADPNGE
ncbi:MAG: hypothetical protein H6629_21470 [Calditrichae bacterium]|nr:hypothetical protein [Calditrichia bacterium]